ncbi:BRCA2 and CDKN1A-interacting protein isoform 2-T2 [Hipposideros larvatus]
MASRPKRRAVGSGASQPLDTRIPRHEEEEEGEVEDEDDEDSEEDEDEDDEVVDELFLKAPVNTAELTGLLIQQNHIGSVIKQTEVSEDSDDDVDEDEIFGFISLLNLTERKGTQCAEQIKELLLSVCEKNCDQRVVEQLDKLLSDTSRPVGFLLSERFMNVPAQIALPMHQQLQKELVEAHKTNKPCGKCYFYLLISKTFVEAGKSNSKRSTQKKDELMFANAEEEFFYEPLEPFMQRQSHNDAKTNRDKKDVPCPQLVVAMRRLLGTWKTETSSLESTDLNCHEESPPQVCRHPAGFAIYTLGRLGKPSRRRRPYAESRVATRNQPSL